MNKFLETDFTIKSNVEKQGRFDRSTVMFELKSKIFVVPTIDYKNANEIFS